LPAREVHAVASSNVDPHLADSSTHGAYVTEISEARRFEADEMRALARMSHSPSSHSSKTSVRWSWYTSVLYPVGYEVSTWPP
jgi:hypothetical protein